MHEIPSGRFADVNPRGSSAYGYTREELLAIDVGTLSAGQPPYTQEEAMKFIARAIAGEQLRFEWHCRNRDSSLRWEEVLLKRVVIGGQDRVLAMTRDITDRKEAAEALARQREALYQREKLAALGSLLAGVARAVLLEKADHPATRAGAHLRALFHHQAFRGRDRGGALGEPRDHRGSRRHADARSPARGRRRVHHRIAGGDSRRARGSDSTVAGRRHDGAGADRR